MLNVPATEPEWSSSVPARDRMPVYAVALGTLGLLAPLPFLGDLRENIIACVALCVCATLFLYAGFHYFRRTGISVRDRDILLVAVLLRLIVLPLQPSLSDDAWRYLWDGRLVAEGISPYHHIPADTALAKYHDELFALQGYPETNTIYPPVAQLIFAGAVSLAEPLGAGPLAAYYLYKLFLIAAELLAIWLLQHLLRHFRRSQTGAMLYAWHPLVVVELAGQGHTDGFWVLALALGIAGFVWNRAGKGLPGLAFGVVVRLFPILLLPLWARFLRKRQLIAGAILSVPILLLLYVFLDPEAFQRYSTVAARFTNYYEFNGGFYLGMKGVLDALHIAPSNRIAGGITTAMMLLGVAAITVWPLKRRTISALMVRVMGIVTLQIGLSAKVHIWYFVLPLYLLAFIPDRRFAMAWLWAALIAPMTYLYYALEPHAELIPVVLTEWGGFVVLMVAGWAGERRKKNRPTPQEPDGIKLDANVRSA